MLTKIIPFSFSCANTLAKERGQTDSFWLLSCGQSHPPHPSLPGSPVFTELTGI